MDKIRLLKNELNDMKQNETVQDAEINEGVEINKN